MYSFAFWIMWVGLSGILFFLQIRMNGTIHVFSIVLYTNFKTRGPHAGLKIVL